MATDEGDSTLFDVIAANSFKMGEYGKFKWHEDETNMHQYEEDTLHYLSGQTRREKRGKPISLWGFVA
ncbi:hypothetical protein T265_05231 [Opisthorchis viverrini]|uniref:Uncharacterized protein n=1 Tax=Opisthorchis viverrini TaxID=6198 RepID=A0A074ZKF7_OPIVI|nr:hypothetical protein T265_05231 [Opisthorchis viverrini]KER27813.1 hypothetical protein T265_05231 [Opisthorchis viverrini]